MPKNRRGQACFMNRSQPRTGAALRASPVQASFRLPTFLPLARRIREILRARPASAAETADLFQMDAGLCLALLGEANAGVRGLGIPVATVDAALQILGEEVVLGVVEGCMRGPRLRSATEDLELLRRGVVTGLAASALAELLGDVDPGEARVAALLRATGPAGGSAWRGALRRALPGRLAAAVAGDAPGSERRREKDLIALLPLAGRLAGFLLGDVEPPGSGDGEDHLGGMATRAHDLVAQHVEDALCVLGVCLGLPRLQIGTFASSMAALSAVEPHPRVLPRGVPRALRETLAGLRVSSHEGRAMECLTRGIRGLQGVKRTVLVLNDAGEAVVRGGDEPLPFCVLLRELRMVVPGMGDLLWGAQEAGRVCVLNQDDDESRLLAALGAECALLLPIGASSRPLGALIVVVESDVAEALAEGLDPLVAAAGETLERIQFTRTGFLITERMTRDSLTQALRRGHLMDLLAAEVRRSNRYQRPLGLVMIDVDHFKQWNDRYGHQTGDRILRDVARAIMDCSREEDLVGRYGGDEFVVVLPGANRDEARRHAERVRRRVESLGRVLKESCYEVPLTVSLGCAAAAAHPVDGRALLFRADHSLYKAKQGGRNRVGEDHGA